MCMHMDLARMHANGCNKGKRFTNCGLLIENASCDRTRSIHQADVPTCGEVEKLGDSARARTLACERAASCN